MRDVERRALRPRRQHLRGSFCTVNLNREKGDSCCEWLDDLRHKHHILHDYTCFSALQETDNLMTSAMNVAGYIVYGNDLGRTAILCPREVNHFRRSWIDNERCTAIMVGSTMLLSVYIYICRTVAVMRRTASRLWRRLTEGKKAGAVDFFIWR